MKSPAKVAILPPLVAERIAAGEVIERPSAVVKELVENALDAGASQIEVRLEDGGKSLIEVIDDGSGMAPDDLALAVKRHATSKLRQVSDLDSLSSLGFRGEALPSIDAVATLKITTRASGLEAYQYVAGKVEPVTYGQFLGREHGTHLQVSGLFQDIPARLKFLKSSASEVAYVRETLERLALAYPDVAFKLIHGEKALLRFTAKDTLADRLAPILSGSADPDLHETRTYAETFEASSPVRRLELHWLPGVSLPHTRKLIQIVNRRAVRDRLIQQAILGPLKQSYLPGQFPAVLAILEVDPTFVDVNVHPSKLELRFQQPRRVFEVFEHAIGQLLEQRRAAFRSPASTSQTSAPAPWAASNANYPSGAAASASFARSAPERTNFAFQSPWLEPVAEAQSELTLPTPSVAPNLAPAPFQLGEWAGSLFDTYLLFRKGERVLVIDQHAAHERLQFEKLKRRWETHLALSAQELMIPETFRLAEGTEVTATLANLEKLGFTAEAFGEDTLIVRAIPTAWTSRAAAVDRERLAALVRRAAETGGAGDEAAFEKIAMEACRSSVRAGDRLEVSEALRLAADLLTCDHPWNCPHGRPTVYELTQGKFEELFQRRPVADRHAFV